jgi:hypothetical protein
MGGALASMRFGANLLEGLLSQSDLTAANSAQYAPGADAAAAAPNWNETGWEDLNAEQRQAFETLGWNEQTWDLGPPPASSQKAWTELSEQERTAATTVGYTQESWDAENEVSPLRPDGTLDLGGKDGVDKAKVDRFLASWDQLDDLTETRTDPNRCPANMVVASLLKKGGLPELKEGLESARTEANKALADARSQTPPDDAKIGRLESAIKAYDETIQAIDEDRVTPQHLDRSADALQKTFSQWPTKEFPKDHSKAGQKIDPYDSEGNAVTGMFHGNTNAMEQAVGLTSKESPTLVEGKDDAEVNQKLWDSIPPGGQTHVGVHGEGELMWREKGLHGEELLPKDGPPYTHYIDGPTGGRVDLAGDVNHAVVFGRNEDGSRYIYNPLGSPPLVTENKDDPKSVAAFDERARMLMARDKNGAYVRATPFDKG